MDDCKHLAIVAEDAGFERDGTRQVVGVCHNCGVAGPPADDSWSAYHAFEEHHAPRPNDKAYRWPSVR